MANKKSFTSVNTDFDFFDSMAVGKAIPATEATETKADVKTEPAPKAKSSVKKPREKKEAKEESLKISVIERGERKTKRASIILTEATYNKIEGYTKKYNCSFNDLVNQILEKIEL